MRIYIENMVPVADYQGEEVMEAPEGMTLGHLMELLHLEQHLATVNKGFVEENYLLREGDRVRFLPVMSGG